MNIEIRDTFGMASMPAGSRLLSRACHIIENGFDCVHTCCFSREWASLIGKESRIKYTFKIHGIERCVIVVSGSSGSKLGGCGGQGGCLKILDQVTILEGPRKTNLCDYTAAAGPHCDREPRCAQECALVVAVALLVLALFVCGEVRPMHDARVNESHSFIKE